MNRQISSLQHPCIKHIVHLRQNSDYRKDHKSVVIEGINMIREVGSAHPIKTLLACHESLIPPGITAKDVLIVDEAVMKKASGMQNSDGLLAEVTMPTFSKLEQARFILALDHVSDPGNLGAALRTALAFGWDGAFLIGEGCDPYNEKALRAARGATFRMPLRVGSWEDFDGLVSKLEVVPIAADLDGEPLTGDRQSNSCVLVLGNEAHGPSSEVLSRCKKVTIPMSGPMESLNVAVAGGILMFLLRRQS